MKLLIAADIFPPESGGPATYAVTLANELVKQMIGVTIVSLNPDGERISRNTYHVTHRNKILRYAQYFFLLFKHAKHSDIVYAMGTVNAGLPAWLAARLRGKKFVVKVVGDYAWEQGQVRFGVTDSIDEFQKQFSKYPFFVQLLKKIESFVVRHTNQVIVPSKYLANIVKGWGTKEEKVKVIYNAVEFKEVVPATKPASEKWIISVARLVPWKGMATLIEIMPAISKEFPKARLKIIGDGPEMLKLVSLIAVLNLGDIVELLGQLPHEKTLSYIKSADIFLLNSAYEGLSHVILEALSYLKPILASDVGGNRESVIPQHTGDRFAFDDKGEIKKMILVYLQGQPYVSYKEKPPIVIQSRLSNMIENTKSALAELINQSTNNQ